MFRGRHAPDGYEFPACAHCNNGSKGVDRIFALMARIRFDSYIDQAHRDEFVKLASAIRQWQPIYEFMFQPLHQSFVCCDALAEDLMKARIALVPEVFVR
jgi:hypothetical protein